MITARPTQSFIERTALWKLRSVLTVFVGIWKGEIRLLHPVMVLIATWHVAPNALFEGFCTYWRTVALQRLWFQPLGVSRWRPSSEGYLEVVLVQQPKVKICQTNIHIEVEVHDTSWGSVTGQEGLKWWHITKVVR